MSDNFAPPVSDLSQPTLGSLGVAAYPTGGQGFALNPDGSVPLAVRKQLPGYTFSYNEFQANVSITATTEATANTIVSATSVSYDGATIVVIDFFSPLVRNSSANPVMFYLYDGSTSLGTLGQIDVTTAGSGSAMRLVRRGTPSAGAHVYSIRASVTAGTGTVFANTGGTGLAEPGFIFVTRS